MSTLGPGEAPGSIHFYFVNRLDSILHHYHLGDEMKVPKYETIPDGQPNRNKTAPSLLTSASHPLPPLQLLRYPQLCS
jgi:hypothetical protein